MGKSRYIQIIGGLIAGMVAHRILVRYTNKPESIHHIESEIENYRGIIADYLTEFNWSDSDKKEIKQESLKDIRLEFKKPHFNDVKFPATEIDRLIDEILKEIFP